MILGELVRGQKIYFKNAIGDANRKSKFVYFIKFVKHTNVNYYVFDYGSDISNVLISEKEMIQGIKNKTIMTFKDFIKINFKHHF